MKTIRLVHFDEDEGLERRKQLEALGFDAVFDAGDGLFMARQIKASHPDAVVIERCDAWAGVRGRGCLRLVMWAISMCLVVMSGGAGGV